MFKIHACWIQDWFNSQLCGMHLVGYLPPYIQPMLMKYLSIILRLKLKWTTWWWWQSGCKDAWIPKFTDTFSWLINIKPVQGKLFVCICLDSFINWSNPFEAVSEYNFDSSVVLISLDHQEEDLALNSPAITERVGLCLLCYL